MIIVKTTKQIHDPEIAVGVYLLASEELISDGEYILCFPIEKPIVLSKYEVMEISTAEMRDIVNYLNRK